MLRPLKEAVAGNVGIDDRGDARILESLAEFGRREFRAYGPAFDRDLAVARVDPDRDAAGIKPRPPAGREPGRGPPPFR